LSDPLDSIIFKEYKKQMVLKNIISLRL
jgi:hypothetical protein